MCLPLAALAIPLTIASTAVSMAGQYAQGKATYTQAKYDQAAANANAALSTDQAKQEIDVTKLEAQRRYRQAGQLEGQQQATMAANGIDLTFGSAAQVKSDSKMIANEDVAQIYKEGFNKTQGYLIDAYNEKLKAGAARATAKSAGLATGLGMLGTALGGASQTAMLRNPSFGG
jgi:hypothetical protein